MYPKMVPRPLKKKEVGGAGIRKRPPTMAEYLNNQVNVHLHVFVYNVCTVYMCMFSSGSNVNLHMMWKLSVSCTCTWQ